MDPKTIPIGETRVVADNGNIKTMLTRITDDYVVSEHLDSASDRVVLRVRLGVFSDSSDVEFVNHGFWKFTVNGEPFTSTDLPKGGKWKPDVETRTINITT